MDIPLVAVVSDHTNSLDALRAELAMALKRIAHLEAIVIGETAAPAVDRFDYPREAIR